MDLVQIVYTPCFGPQLELSHSEATETLRSAGWSKDYYTSFHQVCILICLVFFFLISVEILQIPSEFVPLVIVIVVCTIAAFVT